MHKKKQQHRKQLACVRSASENYDFYEKVPHYFKLLTNSFIQEMLRCQQLKKPNTSLYACHEFTAKWQTVGGRGP